MSTPWYKNGLRFECTQCGKCCTGTPGFIWVSVEEMQKMADELKISLDLFKRKYTRQRDGRFALVEMKKENFSCVFLKDNKCMVYKARPKQCQTFPWWKENLQSRESWEHVKASCEGIADDKPVVPYTEIVSILSLSGSLESDSVSS